MKPESHYVSAASSMLLITLLIFTACSKAVKKTPARETVEPDRGLTREYLKEGFISDDTFRVVIVATENECMNDPDGISAKARKRAYVSLQKYIMSKGKGFDKNTSAEILNLINSNGTFIRRDSKCVKNNIFYYDIKKENISDFINHINERKSYY